MSVYTTIISASHGGEITGSFELREPYTGDLILSASRPHASGTKRLFVSGSIIVSGSDQQILGGSEGNDVKIDL